MDQDRRLELQSLLEELLGSDEVHFQPPASVQLHYPAIIYSREQIVNTPANNVGYKRDLKYTITVVDPDPDSDIVTSISQLPFCKHDRHYASDNLNHDVFTLYY